MVNNQLGVSMHFLKVNNILRFYRLDLDKSRRNNSCLEESPTWQIVTSKVLFIYLFSSSAEFGYFIVTFVLTRTMKRLNYFSVGPGIRITI